MRDRIIPFRVGVFYPRVDRAAMPALVDMPM